MLIVGLQGSPRKRGNTDRLLSAFLEKAEKAGAAVDTIQVAKAGIIPCIGCGYCETHGTCVHADDPMSTRIYGLLRSADMVVAATPVYFYGPSAQLKVLIDRCQTLWSRKYKYALKDPLAATRKGVLLSVAASRGRQLFDAVELITKYFFDAIDARYCSALTYRGIEARGDIQRHPGLDEEIDALVDSCVRPLVQRQRMLFVSAHGALLGPMAAAAAQRRRGDRIRAACAAAAPAETDAPAMVAAMQRAGVDMAFRAPLPIDRAFHGASPDLVVTVGEGAEAALPAGVNRRHLPLARPTATDDEGMDRLVRDIDAAVATLFQSIEDPS